MANLTSVVNVNVDTKDKEQANAILKNLGLNMSTYINMAIKQLIKKDGVPFEISNPKPSRPTKRALKEAEDILSGIKKVKSYSNVEELFEDLDADRYKR